ncbi:MAG: hypothetical protein EOM40_03955 [Clostridia bacterium]|nr:hypothetical protein [Clostridia bacterium]NCC43958.1 hypothetical protein [Clostridia bacterium]
MGGCLFAYILLPAMKKIYRKIPHRTANIIVRLMTIAFLIDVCISILFPNMGVGVTG